LEYLDARRLTGPNLLWDRPGSILDIACTPDEADIVIPFCEEQVRRMLDAVGWSGESIRHIRLSGGASIAFSAPIDALYAASAISEWVWQCCDAEFNGADATDFETSAAEIRTAIAEEVNPALLALDRAARDHGVAFLWDDDEVSVGHGSHSRTWPFRELPDPGDLDWSHFRDVPTGLVTGTNGKTTTVRVAKHLLKSGGLTVGLSCTDWVSVGDTIVDRDDWSGPGGARMVLRQPGIDVAVLETARGGLLRRGLGIEKADAAVITNISEDHLGDFGSRNVDELLDIKWVVSHAVANGGHLILNADDELLVRKSAEFDGEIDWFSLNERNAVVGDHLAAGGTAWLRSGEDLVRKTGDVCDVICPVRDVPLTLDGAAMHNVANALAASALTARMGLSLEQIANGLRSMTQDANPGRSNLHEIGGFRVLVDFAHNPEAMKALFAMASGVPAKRRVLCFGQAGDRTDAQIRELARSAWSIGLDRAFVAELEKYHRGREHGEVFRIIKDELNRCGARDDQIRHFETEAESFAAALDWAESGDLVVILDLGRDSGIQAILQARSGS